LKQNKKKQKTQQKFSEIVLGVKFKDDEELYEAAKMIDLKYHYEAAGDDTLVIYPDDKTPKKRLEQKLKRKWAMKNIFPKFVKVRCTEELTDEELNEFYKTRRPGVPPWGKQR